MSPQTRLSLLLASAGSFATLTAFVGFDAIAAEHQGPWPRHTIDNSSRGADGVRLGDINGDGLQDIVTGWEEGGIVRLYLNPGPEKSKDKWPAVTVGKVNNVEDAVLVDLDNDGTMDVVSSCEGKTKTMYVHWGPKDQAKLLDEDAWQTEAIPATAGIQQWMYCTPMQVDDEHGTDLIVGSKGKGAAVGWLESPENSRDLEAWQYHKIMDAGWVMSLERIDEKHESTVLVSDRKGETRGLYSLSYFENKFLSKWNINTIQKDSAEFMFAAKLPGHKAYAVATRDGLIRTMKMITDDPINLGWYRINSIPNPFGIKHGKAVAIGNIDQDEHIEFVVSFNTQGQEGKPGVAWIDPEHGTSRDQWKAYDISGLEGKKFDRIELIDLDGDGDLDVLTCEEADNLGVIWYENPYGKAKQK